MDWQAVCEVWQRRLRLADWQVEVDLVRAWDLPTPQSHGCIRIFPDKRMARLALRDPQDYRADTWLEYDPTRTIIHELLHIYTRTLSLPDTPAARLAEEQMIHALSEALRGEA